MNILLLSFYYEPDLCAGSFRNTALVRSLRKSMNSGDSIDVLTTMPNRYHSYSQSADARETDGMVTINRIPLPEHKSGFSDQVWSFRAYYGQVWNYLKRNHKHYDMVVASSSRLFTAYLGSRVAKRLKAPLYLDIRDIFTDTLDDVLKNRLVKAGLLPALRKLEKSTIQSADHLNLVSGGFEKYFRKFYSGPVSEFTNGIDNEFFDYEFKSSTNNPVPVVTYAGNIGQGQGLEKIIPEAAAQLSGKFQFKVIGDGGTRKALVSELDKRGVTNVELVDPVDREKLKEHYSDSDYLFLHLNDYDAFKKVLPSKIFEYAATGKPLIAGVSGYSAEFIRNNVENHILFSPCNADELVRKLKKNSLKSTPRNDFADKYRRDNIMDRMADSIMQCAIAKNGVS